VQCIWQQPNQFELQYALCQSYQDRLRPLLTGPHQFAVGYIMRNLQACGCGVHVTEQSTTARTRASARCNRVDSALVKASYSSRNLQACGCSKNVADEVAG
jgi:hypothetical protein